LRYEFFARKHNSPPATFFLPAKRRHQTWSIQHKINIAIFRAFNWARFVLSDRKVSIHSRSLSSAIWENPINLLKFLAVVGTWPLTSISYGPVRLCAAISQSPGVVKFAGRFWNIISLKFLLIVEISSKSSVPIKEAQPKAHEEPLEEPAPEEPAPEEPEPTDPDDLYADPAAESAINALVREVCVTGDNIFPRDILDHMHYALNENEFLKALEKKILLLPLELKVGWLLTTLADAKFMQSKKY
jgi:hypothetical protein